MEVKSFAASVIEDYAVRHTTPLSPLIKDLSAATAELFGEWARGLPWAIEGTLLQMLVASVGARRILEVGTWTGLKALMMAAALPPDGELITCDDNPAALRIARDFFAHSPHGPVIRVHEGPPLETLRTLEGPFEFVWIDAEKQEYVEYYEIALSLLAPNGIIAVDDVLCILDSDVERARPVAEFNKHVASDPRVTQVLLPLGAGIMLIRRK
jgi:caffeoyl-CoA O-methyltransferase